MPTRVLIFGSLVSLELSLAHELLWAACGGRFWVILITFGSTFATFRKQNIAAYSVFAVVN